MTDKRQYVIELDGVFYRITGNNLARISDIRDIKGDCIFITDMQGTVSRAMTVEGNVKYVEHMVRKKLQETGEFDEPVSIITHWKKKKSKNSADIFFSALPTRLYFQYLDRVKDYEDSLLLFPLYSVLHSVLKHARLKEPAAVIFQHNRFADLIIGTKSRIYYSGRFVAFDTSEEQIESLWNRIKHDIDTVKSDFRIDVSRAFFMTWIDSLPLPQCQEDMECEFFSLEEEPVSLNGDIFNISLTTAIKMQPVINGISPFKEKILYLSKKSAPYLNMLLLLVFILLSGGYFWCHQQLNVLKKESVRLENKIEKIKQKLPSALHGSNYKKPMEFIKSLSFYRSAPSYKKIINDVSGAVSDEMKLQVIKADYNYDRVQLEIFGTIKAPFDTAHNKYSHFRNILKQKGYRIKESRFDTKIRDSQFLIKLTGRIG